LDAPRLLARTGSAHPERLTSSITFCGQVAYNARRLASHPSLVVYSGNNEGSVFGDVHLYVDVQLATMQRENPNVIVYPSCPSYGWASLSPLVPRPLATLVCHEGGGGGGGVDAVCPHDSHYYGPCGTIPIGANFGSEFGWPSGDIFAVMAAITPEGQDVLRAQTGASPFLDYRSTVKITDWTIDSMLYPNSTLMRTLPSLLTEEDNTTAGMERWLYLTQALQTHCVGTSVSTYRQHSQVMGSLNWALNSIWTAPAWGSISHDGSWKMLHYRLRHVFAPVLLSFNYPTDTIKPANHYIPMPSSCATGSICLHLSNHREMDFQAQCTLVLRDYAQGHSLASVAFSVKVPPGEGLDCFTRSLVSIVAGSTRVCGANSTACFLLAECRENDSGKTVASQPYFPSSLATAQLSAAAISVSGITPEMGTDAGSGMISFRAASNTTAPFTFFSSTLPGVFSDNSMTLLPGTAYNLTFTARMASGITADVFLRSLRVYCANNKRPTFFLGAGL